MTDPALRNLAASLLAPLLLAACGGGPESAAPVPADLVLLDAAVYTVNGELPWAEAVAVRGPQIVFVGSNEAARRYVGENTALHELGGGMLLPGFHDSHTHLLPSVIPDDECDLLRLDSLEAVERRLRECRSLPGRGPAGWIVGAGWAEWLWPDSHPDGELLDELFPDRPVYLESSFGHSAWVNARALALAQIGSSSGGRIVHGAAP